MLFVIAIPFNVFVVLVGVFFLFGLGNPLILIIGVAFMIWIVRYLGGNLPTRSVLFRRDGAILVPHGTPGHKKATWINVNQSEVVSFEIGPAFSGMQQDWTSTVQLVTEEGDTVTLSRFLHREEARKVVVGLNRALREMRASVGTEPMQRGQSMGARVLVD
jgi:hypothetical protein